MQTTLRIDPKDPLVALIPNIVYSQVPTYFGKVPLALHLHLLQSDECAPGEKLPTVVWIIGGAWRETAPLWRAPELTFLAKAGYNVALIDYRVHSQGYFPAAVQDVKTAIRFLRAHAEQYHVDPDRIAVMGDSAGGYLTALTAASAGVPEFESAEWQGFDSGVKAAVDFYGPIDLKYAKDHPYPNMADKHVTFETIFLTEEGMADPETLRLSNPLSFITEKAPPFLIFHGTADEQVLPDHSLMLYEALRAKGVPSDLYLIEGAMHATAEFLQPEIKALILDFFKKYL
ncbi:MAG: alpha/beta hydrolase [Oscillospiraceae bacterium]|nr:alpha/beta hydrolase [Oscillospiraceae bacterium]